MLQSRIKKNKGKEWRTVSETSGTTLSTTIFELLGSQKKKKTKKGLTKYLKRL